MPEVSKTRILTWVLLALGLCHLALSQTTSFKQEQLRYPRVRAAYASKQARVTELFAGKGVTYPPQQLLFRAFKREPGFPHGIVEVWASSERAKPLRLITQYIVCAASGVLGPKRRQGDLQVPEGFYLVDRYNPASRFHLSFSIDYPNRSDRLLGHPSHPGGDIFIHGACASIGCLAMKDEMIKELYIMAVDVRSATGRPLGFHLFPLRMDDTGMEKLDALAGENQRLGAFWRNLRQGYELFERTRLIPQVTIDGKTGRYLFSLPDSVPGH